MRNRPTSIKVNNYVSPNPRDVIYSVPQGSVLGRTLFNIILHTHRQCYLENNISCHMYADDTQMYMDFRDSRENAAMSCIQSCMQDIKA